VLAATNADLEARVRGGAFRQDLFYRLARLEVRLTPLRERRQDILPLVGCFLAEGRTDGLVPTLTPELRAAFEGGAWPGNARELRNAVERMRLTNSDKLHYELTDFRGAPDAKQNAGPGAAAEAERVPAALPDGTARRAAADGASAQMLNLRSAFRRLDRLRAAFREHRKLSRTEAARLLDVSLPTATRDLRTLCAEGLVRKVTPSASPASHYFAIREGSG
jgi:DNA-binding NtrC family response regulator